jgi:hypothetical protein
MSLRRRLERLEEVHYPATPREDAIFCEVLRRMSDEELDHYERAFKRAQASGEFLEEDGPIVERVEALYGEVADALPSREETEEM